MAAHKIFNAIIADAQNTFSFFSGHLMPLQKENEGVYSPGQEDNKNNLE